ncbi:MAG: hypothetical protein GWO86_01440 [Planctomycetes bacterium]|nr:hypothetical protein [Planctomycetota bacterium]
MNRKLKTTGFTIAELLTVIAVLAILLGILMPALNQAKKMARQTKQKSQINSIDIGLNIYKNDQGDYPPSHGYNKDYSYCGAQTLTEAMFGQDLLGYHPDSKYEPTDPGNLYNNQSTLNSRKGPYLDRTNIDVFKAGPVGPDDGVFNPFQNTGLVKDGYVICDVFTAVNRTITLPNGDKKTFKVGTPVLYFKANTSSTDIKDTTNIDKRIYNFWDNELLVAQGRITDGKQHKEFFTGGGGNSAYEPFYTYIEDTIASTSSLRRPVRPDTFLLISAGYDGLYGTSDDICNFEPNIK